jgi:hypothetical protein
VSGEFLFRKEDIRFELPLKLGELDSANISQCPSNGGGLLLAEICQPNCVMTLFSNAQSIIILQPIILFFPESRLVLSSHDGRSLGLFC